MTFKYTHMAKLADTLDFGSVNQQRFYCNC